MSKRFTQLKGKKRVPWNKGIKKWWYSSTEFKKGHKAWNKDTKGMQVAWNKGIKGYQVAWNKGKRQPQDVRKRISIALKGHIPWNKGKKGIQSRENHPLWGKHHTQTTKDTISKKNKKFYADPKNNPNWLGGKSFEPYGLDFNKDLKEFIRKRDSYKCQECRMTQEKLGKKLDCHHINYNKKDNRPQNLIALCYLCHLKTNYSRDDWQRYFKTKIKLN